jgi:hypothetical protein
LLLLLVVVVVVVLLLLLLVVVVLLLFLFPESFIPISIYYFYSNVIHFIFMILSFSSFPSLSLLTPQAGVEPIRVEVREYDRLFLSEDPVAVHGKEWLKDLNPSSLKVVHCVIDPSIAGMKGDFCCFGCTFVFPFLFFLFSSFLYFN